MVRTAFGRTFLAGASAQGGGENCRSLVTSPAATLRAQAVSAAGSERSSSRRSGACFASTAREHAPVATATTPRPGGAGARDVELGVAHHDAARGRHAVALRHACDRDARQGVAVLRFLAEGAEREALADSEAVELDARHLGHVPGEEPGDPRGLRLDPVEQRLDAGEQPPARRAKRVAHRIEHAVPETGLLAVGEAHAVLRENVREDQRLGAPGERDVAERIVGAEALAHRAGERLARGALGGEERTVHVEQPGEPGCRDHVKCRPFAPFGSAGTGIVGRRARATC
jgi:hypothetical protein